MIKPISCAAYINSMCVPNPGGRGAYGIVLKYSNQEIVTLNGGRSRTTAHRVLLYSVIRILEELDRSIHIQIYSRSEYIIQSINSKGSRKSNTDLWNIIDRISKGRNIEWSYQRNKEDDKYFAKCSTLVEDFLCSNKNIVLDGGYSENIVAAENWKIKTSFETTERNEIIEAENLNKKFGTNRYLTQKKAEEIKLFNQKDKKKFRDYAALKTGGIDYWSEKDISFFNDYFGAVFVNKMRSYLGNEKDLCSFFRWHCRGLTISDAIQKVKTDAQIRYNANMNSY